MIKMTKTDNETSREASYHVSYCIPFSEEAHTTGEMLIISSLV
jgi:hypothetical protein